MRVNKNQQRKKWIRTSGHGFADLPQVMIYHSRGRWEHKVPERSHPCSQGFAHLRYTARWAFFRLKFKISGNKKLFTGVRYYANKRNTRG